MPVIPDRTRSTTRLGLIVLSTDMATEPDFCRALAGHDVEFHTTRVRNTNPVTVENLRTMGPKLTDCASLLLPEMPLDVIAYSCTSGTVALGYNTVAGQIAAGRGDVPIITPVTAALAAFEAIRVSKIALMTPYLQTVGEAVGAYLEEQGFSIVRQTHLGYASDADMAFIPPDDVRREAEAADHPDAEALFISCTALRAMVGLSALEATVGKPCLSSIQCLLWQALREGGYRKPVGNNGSLLER